MTTSAGPVIDQVLTHDGIDLHTEVFLGGASTSARPALLLRTPYGCADQRAEASTLAARGFAVVLQDVRGRFESGGTFDFGLRDAEDGCTTIRWIATQTWCDGRVALRGLSYAAFTQWSALTSAPDELACAAPVMGPVSPAALGLQSGGALELALLTHWLPGQAASSPGLDVATADDLRRAAFDPADVIDARSGYVDAELARWHPALGSPPVMAAALGRTPVFSERWRAALSGSPEEHRTPEVQSRTPVLVFGGWYDPFLSSSIAAFGALPGDDHRMIIAGFGHGFDPPRAFPPTATAGRFGFSPDVAWAEEHLLGIDHGLARLDPVTWYVVGADRWRSAPTWPPPDARRAELHLSPSGGLRQGRVDGAGRVDFTHEPSWPLPSRGGNGMLLPPGRAVVTDLSGPDHPAVASFTSEPLVDDLEVAGPVRFRAVVDTDANGLDLVVRLSEVDPSGTVVSIVSGVRRLVGVNGPVEAVVDLGHIAHLVPAGRSLRVDLMGSDHPRHDVHPMVPATHCVIFDERDSNVLTFTHIDKAAS